MKNYLFVLIFSFLILIIFAVWWKQEQHQALIKPQPKGGSMIIRNPAVAGQFYPGDKRELEEMVEGFLSKAKSGTEKGQLSVLIVPHAGYVYSGQTAASGFKRLSGKNIFNVILLGASHQSWFSGVAVDNNDSWGTPLGKVKINKDLAERLITGGISFNKEPHLNEHSLEVEVPFLQSVLKDFFIAPLLIGQTDNKTLEKLAEKIIENLDSETVLVVSSDLSHYPDINTAKIVDERTVKSIESGEVKKFEKELASLAKDYPNVDTFACGHEAIKVGMIVASKLGILKSEVFAKTNSGEVMGETNRVVGYASVGFYTKKNESEELNKDSQKELLRFSRKVLESYIKNGTLPDDKTDNENLLKKRGAFVTLTKKAELRGCIGDFSASKSLWETVKSMTIAASTEDPRFWPVKKEELSDIGIEISVLSKRLKVSSYKEIVMGKHGVYLERGGRGGTFLPQVAEDFNNDRDAFLSALCSHKAGLPSDCYKDPKTNLDVYTAQVFNEKELKK